MFGALRCMCGTCARDLLSTCTCETAEEARQKIRAKLKAGEDRDQILAEYSAQYGTDGLSVPPNRGALRAIWAVPVLGIGLGAVGLARLVKSWRLGSVPAGAIDSVKAPRDVYDTRLDDELKDLDG